jgi:BASS family bile acid:Na+ symporter
LNGTPGGKDFDDPKVLVMIIVVAVVGLLILMPLARVLGTRGAKTPA